MKFIFYFKSTYKYEVTVLEKKSFLFCTTYVKKKKKTLVQNPGQLRRSGKTHQVSTVVSCEAKLITKYPGLGPFFNHKN